MTEDDGFVQLSFINEELQQKAPAKKPRTKKETTTKSETQTQKTSQTKTQPEQRDQVMTEQETKDEKFDFEASLLELEGVVKQLDSEVKLDRALQLFESGIKLSVECEHFIKGAKKKIEILKKKADGSLELSEFVASTSQLD